MRRSRAAICSGASYRNSGITSTLRTACTMAATSSRYSMKRSAFWPPL
ncbi:Uncharacterised protein [Bordetella pertussis]|nr:Uncharacterised protein [Bordetella pertussis]CFO35783.1 Uncharacterised protein [Bordetella pertussis]CFU06555.1 Uncharacterised protein [Bordetella pertussis]CFW14414.1 Uncharacterised protein [Bordetella pertussis]CFW43073.1 Uncharacterised protein [Bordetella pertussis]